MDYLAFVRLPEIEGVSSKEATLRLWHHIYAWIVQHGYADVSDTPEFVKYVQSFRKIETSTISGHLLEMSKIKLIARRVLRRKLPEAIRTELNSSISGMMFGGDMSSLPTSIVRYTLPGQKCSTEFKTAFSLIERNNAKDASLLSNRSIWRNPATNN